MEVLATRCECPFIFCEKSNSGDWVNSRYWKRLRFTLLEFFEHSETCSDRREHALEVIFHVDVSGGRRKGGREIDDTGNI